jgi:hypothetical protein
MTSSLITSSVLIISYIKLSTAIILILSINDKVIIRIFSFMWSKKPLI